MEICLFRRDLVTNLSYIHYIGSATTLPLSAMKLACSATRLWSSRLVRNDRPAVQMANAIEQAIIAHIPL